MGISQSNSGAYWINHQGREMISHGTTLFPIAFYNDNLERERVPWHWHEEMEAVYIASGKTVFATDSSRMELEEGQGFFINSNILHAADGIPGTGCTYHSLVFHPRLIGGGIDSVFWQKYLRRLMGSGMKSRVLDPAESWQRTALTKIEEAWQEGAAEKPGFEFRVRAALSELIFLMTSHLPESEKRISGKAMRDGERIKQMLRYIRENYTEEISVADIAGSAMLSESECLRCFRNTIDMPPMQYVRRFRVQKAAELLTYTDLTVAEISAQCGFQDPSYFTRIFREIKQMTPGAYRERRGG